MTPNITEWSKYKLNKAIAEILEPAIWEYWRKFDCFNWNNLMPLVESNTASFNITNRGDHFLVRMVVLDLSDSFVTSAKTLNRAMAEAIYLVLLAKSQENNND